MLFMLISILLRWHKAQSDTRRTVIYRPSSRSEKVRSRTSATSSASHTSHCRGSSRDDYPVVYLVLGRTLRKLLFEGVDAFLKLLDPIQSPSAPLFDPAIETNELILVDLLLFQVLHVPLDTTDAGALTVLPAPNPSTPSSTSLTRSSNPSTVARIRRNVSTASAATMASVSSFSFARANSTPSSLSP